jgi:hypothetical protein
MKVHILSYNVRGLNGSESLEAWILLVKYLSTLVFVLVQEQKLTTTKHKKLAKPFGRRLNVGQFKLHLSMALRTQMMEWAKEGH